MKANRKTPEHLRDRLKQVVEKQQQVLMQLQELISDSDASSASLERTQRQLNKLSAEQTQLIADLRLTQLETPDRYGAYGGLTGHRPMREEVLDILDEIGVPASPRLISDFATAVYGRELPVERFASLRRDDEKAYEKDPTSRPAWVAPAINAQEFTAIPRIVTSSAWELERRLIGSRTLRTNHLYIILALLQRNEQVGSVVDQRAATQLGMLIVRYAETVPGAVARGVKPDYQRIREAAQAELKLIEPLDLEERRNAVIDLLKLGPKNRVWGKLTPVDFEAVSHRGSA